VRVARAAAGARALAHKLAHEHKNPCKSPYLRLSRKPFRALGSDEGSNPSPSAQPSGSRVETRCGGMVCGLEDLSSQSVGVHRGLWKSTGFSGHWRTTGARPRAHFVSAKATTRTNVVGLGPARLVFIIVSFSLLATNAAG